MALQAISQKRRIVQDGEGDWEGVSHGGGKRSIGMPKGGKADPGTPLKKKKDFALD